MSHFCSRRSSGSRLSPRAAIAVSYRLETIFQLMMTIVGSNWASAAARLFAFENKLKLLITLAFYTFRGCCKRRLAKREPVFLDSSSHFWASHFDESAERDGCVFVLSLLT